MHSSCHHRPCHSPVFPKGAAASPIQHDTLAHFAHLHNLLGSVGIRVCRSPSEGHNLVAESADRGLEVLPQLQGYWDFPPVSLTEHEGKNLGEPMCTS